MLPANGSAFFARGLVGDDSKEHDAPPDSSFQEVDLVAFLNSLLSFLTGYDLVLRNHGVIKLTQLLDAAIHSNSTIEKYSAPSLQKHWADCFVALEDTKSKFKQMLLWESRAFLQLLSTRIMERVQQMHRANNVKTSLAYIENYDKNTLRLLTLAANMGSFSAAVRLQYYYLTQLSACTCLEKCEEIMGAVIPIAEAALECHRMPGALLLAEACYYSAVALQANGGKAETIMQYFNQTLFHLCLARELESTSAVAIHNAYRGRSLPEASQQKMLTAKMDIYLTESGNQQVCWNRFIEDCACYIFGINRDQKAVIAPIIHQISTDAKDLVSAANRSSAHPAPPSCGKQ